LAGLKIGYFGVGVFFKSFPQSSSSFVWFFVLFGGEGGVDFLRCSGAASADSAARFEPADESEIKIQVPALPRHTHL
jgi:hypothetical protein